MTKTEKICLSLALLVALAGVATVAFSYYFSIKVISSGEAYGFQIGDGRQTTYKNAKILLEQKEITAIHTWPKDQFHRPFKANETAVQNTDSSWVMVVNPDWWNNTITVTFKSDVITEIKRDRIYCELP